MRTLAASLAVALGLVGLLPVGAAATYTSTIAGTTGTMVGDDASDSLVVDVDGVLIRHNRMNAGDPFFNSAADWDVSTLGDQTLGADGATSLSIAAGAGNDGVALPTVAVGASYGSSVIEGGPGLDTITTGAGADQINVADGEADNVSCGGGVDSVSADALDTVLGNCDAVSRPPPVTAPKKKCKKKGKSAGAAKKKRCKKRKK